MKWIKRFFYFLGFLYFFICIAGFFMQEKLIFHPTELPANFQFWVGEEVYIPIDDGLKMHAMWLRHPNSKGVILYWHGNMGSNRRCLRQAEHIFSGGYDVFMPDYRGYGKTEGRVASEKQIMADAQRAYDYLREHYDEKKLSICGYSLGTGIATRLAVHNNPRQLLLMAPYKSLVAMKNKIAPFLPSFLMKYKFRTDENIVKVNCPVTLFHGINDELIPYDHSVYLQNLAPDNIQLISLNGTGHRGVIFSNTIPYILRK